MKEVSRYLRDLRAAISWLRYVRHVSVVAPAATANLRPLAGPPFARSGHIAGADTLAEVRVLNGPLAPKPTRKMNIIGAGADIRMVY
jgi:hypothetical protein